MSICKVEKSSYLQRSANDRPVTQIAGLSRKRVEKWNYMTRPAECVSAAQTKPSVDDGLSCRMALKDANGNLAMPASLRPAVGQLVAAFARKK